MEQNKIESNKTKKKHTHTGKKRKMENSKIGNNVDK